MKLINFIRPIPLALEREIRHWFYGSLFFLAILCITLSCIQWKLHQQLLHLQKQKAELQQEYAPAIAAQEKCKEKEKERETLQNKQKQIDAWKLCPGNPAPYLDAIFKITKQHDCAINSLKGSVEKGFELNGISTHSTKLEACLQNLATNSLFSNIELISLKKASGKNTDIAFSLKITMPIEK